MYDESNVDFSGRKPDFEMLFDLEADPEEKNNLAEALADSEILATLRIRCTTHSETLNKRRETLRNTMHIERR